MRRLLKFICFSILLIFTSTTFLGCNEHEKEVDENTLKIWGNLLDNEVDEFQKIADKWTEKSGIEVKIYATTATATNYIESKDSARPDIFLGASSEETGMYKKANIVEVVPEDFNTKDDVVSEDILKATMIDEIQYGVPLTQETVVLYYNKDLVDKVPETMEELIEIAREKGIAFEANNYYFSYGFISAFGGYIYKENENGFDYTDIGTDTSESINGLQYLQDLFTKDNLFLAGTTDIMASGNFEAGKVAFYIGEAGRVRSFNNAEVNFGVSKIPSVNGNEVKPYKYVKMAVLDSNITKKEQAWDLLKEFIDKSDEVFMKTGPYAPTYKKSLESDTFKNDEYVKALYEQCNSSVLLPNIIENQAINYVVNGCLDKLVLGEITPKECGESMKKELEQTIQDILIYED